MSSDPLPFQRVGFLQFDIETGNIDTNLKRVKEGLQGLSPRLDGRRPLIVLPEMWATGFAYGRLDSLSGQMTSLCKTLQELASQHNCMLAGSLPEKEQGGAGIFNTLYFIDAGGIAARYRKQYLFAPMGENIHLKAATEMAAVNVHGIPLAALVCYDLRFPELARQQVGTGAELLVVSAQWPNVRNDHWRILLQARAIENQIFVIGANRCGADTVGEKTLFGGHSMIIAPDGAILYEAGEDPEEAIVDIDEGLVTNVRSRFNSAAPAPHRNPDRNKICDLHTLTEIRRQLGKIGRRLVFTNGCFDILHSGHVTYLEQARKEGDCLIVGLNSDSSVRSIKGPGRPINNERDRSRTLAALGCVDYIVLFSDDTPLQLINTLTPDVLVKGADWQEDKIVGADEVRARGGMVVRIELVPDTSTTSIIARISG